MEATAARPRGRVWDQPGPCWPQQEQFWGQWVLCAWTPTQPVSLQPLQEEAWGQSGPSGQRHSRSSEDAQQAAPRAQQPDSCPHRPLLPAQQVPHPLCPLPLPSSIFSSSSGRTPEAARMLRYLSLAGSERATEKMTGWPSHTW